MRKFFLICASVYSLAPNLFAEERKVLLKTDFPPYLFSMNAPVGFLATNMETNRSRGKREFYVPVGTANLAFHKPVTASCRAAAGNLAMVTDGNKFGDDGWMELEAGKQWVQVDLQKSSEIFAVFVWHYYYQIRVYMNVVVAISDDPEFKKDVKVVFNNDIENVSGLGKGSDFNYIEDNWGKLIDAKGVSGRYVRLYSNGNSDNKMNHYVEVEVFGKKIEFDTPTKALKEPKQN